jgi:hypothetical protein
MLNKIRFLLTLMAVETIILFLAIIAVIAVYIVLRTAKYLIVNSILGLILLLPRALNECSRFQGLL